MKSHEIIAIGKQMSQLEQEKNSLKEENEKLKRTINDIHLELTTLRCDATDGRNWKTLIGNAAKELIEKRNELIILKKND